MFRSKLIKLSTFILVAIMASLLSCRELRQPKVQRFVVYSTYGGAKSKRLDLVNITRLACSNAKIGFFQVGMQSSDVDCALHAFVVERPDGQSVVLEALTYEGKMSADDVVKAEIFVSELKKEPRIFEFYDLSQKRGHDVINFNRFKKP